jgi:hypothetical protein
MKLQYILYPWSHTADLPPDADELVCYIEKPINVKLISKTIQQDSIGQEANLAIIGVNNNSYTVGTFHDALCIRFQSINTF